MYKKILILRFSSLGDIVLTTPVLSKLRKAFPKAQIDMVVKKEFSDCIKGNPNLNNVIEFDSSLGFKGLREFIQLLRKEKYELFVDIHRSLRSRIILFFVKGKKLKYSKDTFRRLVLLKLRLNLYNHFPKKMEEYLKILNKLNIDTSIEPTLMTFTKENLSKSQEIANQLYKKKKKNNIVNNNNNANEKVTIGLAPGAAHFLKKWPLGKYKELIYLLSERLNCRFLVFGGPDDFECEHLDSLPLDLINLQGHLQLKETAALISRCDVFIGNDSGLSHIAEAVNVDALSFFGPTSQHFGYFPYREGSHVFQKDLSCRPCSKNGKGKCKNRSLKKCLEDISSDTIADFVVDYFKKKAK